jgi:peptidoglycan/LPS O-acetylase OafA/YrhL
MCLFFVAVGEKMDSKRNKKKWVRAILLLLIAIAALISVWLFTSAEVTKNTNTQTAGLLTFLAIGILFVAYIGLRERSLG